MDNSSKVELFERMPLMRAITKLTVPTIISCLVMIIYNLADTYFVGMLNDPVQNSAVTLAAPVLLAFNAINNLFGTGGASMMSRAMGRKDFDTVSRSSAFSFYGAIFSGLLLAIGCTVFMNPLLNLLGSDPNTIDATRDYLIWTTSFGAVPSILNVVMANLVRSEGNSMHAGIGTITGCVLNIILDPIFIMPWGLNMGSAGAGLATMISNTVSCVYFFVLIYVRRKSTWVCIKPRMFSLNPYIVKGVFGVGFPASIQNLLNVTGMTVLNNFTSVYGPDAIAAMGISQKINMIPMYIALGLAQGIMPLISYNYASGNHKRMKDGFKTTAVMTTLFLSITVILCCVFSRDILRAFIDNDAVVAYGTRFLRGLCLATPFLAMDFLVVGVFQAIGKGGHSLVFAILRKVVLEIPGLVILNMLFPLYGLTYAQAVAEVILSVLAVIIITRMFKKMNNHVPIPE